MFGENTVPSCTALTMMIAPRLKKVKMIYQVKLVTNAVYIVKPGARNAVQ